MAKEVAGSLIYDSKLDNSGFEKGLNSIQTSAVAKGQIIADAFEKIISCAKDFALETINTGKQFDSSMSEVSAISGATGNELDALRNKAKEMGSATKFTATEAAEALKYMSLAGWTSEESMSALDGVLNLAAASGMELAQASDMVTDYLSAFSMKASESAYFADMLAYAQSHSNTTAEQLGEAYRNCAANLNAAGQDVQTVTSLLEAMANQGYKGSEAGTALSAIMRDVTNNMKNGSIQIGKTKVSVQDASGNFRDLTEIVKDVSRAVDGMGDAQRATALSSTFTADSTKGLNLILNEGIDKIAGYEEELRNCDGSAEKMAETMQDNLDGDLTKLNSKFEGLQITLYEKLEPALRSGVEVLNGVLNIVESAINHLQEIGVVLIPVITAIATLWGYLKMVAIVQKIKDAFIALNAVMTANPIGIIIALIAALVAGFIYLWNNCEDFRNFWINLWENIKNIFSKVINAIVNFFTKTIPDAVSNFITFLEQISQWFSELPGKIWNWLLDTVSKVTEWIVTMNINFVQGVQNIINNVITFFSELPGKVWEWLVNTIQNIVKWIVETNQKANEMARNFINNIINKIKELPGKIWEWLKNTISKVAQFAVDMANKSKEAATNLFNNIVNKIKELPSKMLEMGRNIVEGIWNGIKNATSWIVGKVKEFASSVVGGIKNALGIHSPSTVFRDEVGKFIPAGVAVGIEANTDEAIDSIKAMDDEILDEMNKAVVTETGSINANASVKANNSTLTVINVNCEIEGTVNMDSDKVGKIAAPAVIKTIRYGGIKKC